MKRTEGSAVVKLLECVNPVKNKWRIRWDVIVKEDGSANYMEAEFTNGKPSVDDIKRTVLDWYNEQTDQAIISGFTYKGLAVWLSTENQFNYKAAYDLAVQTEGKTLPVTFKFGTEDEPSYHTFDTLEELADFYLKATEYVQNTLAEGWKKKDAFDLSLYQ